MERIFGKRSFNYQKPMQEEEAQVQEIIEKVVKDL